MTLFLKTHKYICLGCKEISYQDEGVRTFKIDARHLYELWFSCRLASCYKPILWLMTNDDDFHDPENFKKITYWEWIYMWRTFTWLSCCFWIVPYYRAHQFIWEWYIRKLRVLNCAFMSRKLQLHQHSHTTKRLTHWADSTTIVLFYCDPGFHLLQHHQVALRHLRQYWNRNGYQ
jgi:hypothetical protein